MHTKEGLSFRNVTAFNLDEYYPMDPQALQSYHRFMHEHLFSLVDIDKGRVHIPDGTTPASDVARSLTIIYAWPDCQHDNLDASFFLPCLMMVLKGLLSWGRAVISSSFSAR